MDARCLNLILRAMRESEQTEVAKLHHDAWHETHAHLQDPRIAEYRGLSFFTTRAAGRWPHSLVAESGGRLVGFSSWTKAHFNSLFVAPGFRVSGIGTALLKATEAEMEKGAAHPFDLFCIYGNDAGRRFYERHGWRVDHESQRLTETRDGEALVRTWVMIK